MATDREKEQQEEEWSVEAQLAYDLIQTERDRDSLLAQLAEAQRERDRLRALLEEWLLWHDLRDGKHWPPLKESRDLARAEQEAK